MRNAFAGLRTVVLAGLLLAGAPMLTGAPANAACTDDGCPNANPNVDCWTNGQWYYNHCNQACI